MVRGLFFLLFLLPLNTVVAGPPPPRPAAMLCDAWLSPSSVAWVRMALLPHYPAAPIPEEWMTFSQNWFMAIEMQRKAMIRRRLSEEQADRLLVRGYDHLNAELTRFAGRQGQFEPVATAEEYVISTHQTSWLQGATAKALATSAEFSALPRVLLVSTAYTNSDGALLGQASEIHYSSIGEFAPGPFARRVHLMGGYSSQCLSRTADSLVHSFMEDPARSELELIFHSSLIYMTGIRGTLSEGLFSHGLYPGDLGYAGDPNDLFLPSVGMATVASSSVTTEDPDGSRAVRVVMHFQGGKTLRITIR